MLRAPVSPLASVGPPPLVRRLPERRSWRRSEGMSPGPAGPRSCFTPSPQSDQRVISMYQSSEIDALSRRAREGARSEWPLTGVSCAKELPCNRCLVFLFNQELAGSLARSLSLARGAGSLSLRCKAAFAAGCAVRRMPTPSPLPRPAPRARGGGDDVLPQAKTGKSGQKLLLK